MFTSRVKNVKYGLPQDTVVDPVLFNMYINDLLSSNEELSFANDTVGFSSADLRELDEDDLKITGFLSLIILKHFWILQARKAISLTIILTLNIISNIKQLQTNSNKRKYSCMSHGFKLFFFFSISKNF